MNTKVNQEKIEGRFDKVLSYYWDGVPAPLIYDTEKLCTQTFLCRQLAFTPDYHGETVNLPLTEPTQASLFSTLSSQTFGPQPASCRIGSHYSLYVGLFCFPEVKHPSKSVVSKAKPAVRVPVEYCEKREEYENELFTTHCRIRTGKLISLYKPLIKEHLPLSRSSLRNIIVLSSRGCTSVSREIIAREISDVNEEYANAMSEAIFFYMCLNPLQRHILKPLQLATTPEPPTQSIKKTPQSDKAALHRQFTDARNQLKRQLFWDPSTRGYFVALQSMWEEKFERLLLLSTDHFSSTVDVASFIDQMKNSVNSVVARIRIEFYANVEEFFFSLIPTAKEVLLISEKEFEGSVFKRIFVATEVFLVNKMRDLIFTGLDNVVSFFDCGGFSSATGLAKRAQQASFLRLDLLTSEFFQPRAPAVALLLFGIRDLIMELEVGVNNLPSIGGVILRTMKLEEKRINVVSRVEVASYRASIARMLNDVALVVDDILSSYKVFCSIPVQNLALARTGSAADVAKHVLFARQQVTEIYRVSHQQMYCGRFEIHCAALQESLANEWKSYTAALTSAFQQTVVCVVESAKKRSRTILQVFDTIPSNVEELEAHLQNTEAAKAFADDLRSLDCQEILARVTCMEDLYVPIEQNVCDAVFEFMKLPGELLNEATKAGNVRERCAPLLLRKLGQLRTTTREYMQTLSTGVTELYHLFNLETCDIAAQTCAELRELVDRIDVNLKRIAHEEEVLGIHSGDTFETFPSLLHYFEVIEQFWNSLFDAAKLRDMYNTSIGSLNATACVDRVREWRRLIHSSTRHLRGFPTLLQLGREQEVALSKFEELGLFLEVISSQNLRKNHWKDIAKLVAAQLREDVASVMDLSITVTRLIDAGLMEHMDALGQIANQAQCDYEVESALEEMRSYGKRTHFVFENSHGSVGLRTSVTQSFLREASSHIEQFIIQCRSMRSYPNLGQLVRKSLLEWESACEKSCEMLAAFHSVQEGSVWVESCLHTLQMTPMDGKGSADNQRRALMQHLSTASEAIRRLHTTLQKPQFSLYTAMVQDTIQDVFFVAKAAVDDAVGVLRQSLDQRRAVFPRFRFLSDTQLVEFQFVLRPASFIPLFPFLYSQLTGVETVDGKVTAVVAADGSTLPLVNPLPLAAPSADVWMQQLDHAMRTSLLAAVKCCIAAHYNCDLESWVSGWSGQVVLLAMRIMHTEGLRRVVQIGGAEAIQAYASSVSDRCCALSQLALQLKERGLSVFAEGGGVAATVKAAIAYSQFGLQEIKLAIEWGIHSIAELDCTPLLQTSFTPSGDGIRVSFLGVSAEHGLEFIGNGSTPFVGLSQWRQLAVVLADLELGRSVPLAYREGNEGVGDGLQKNAAELFGRFSLRVELTPQTITETLAPLLRGCVETGAFLYLANCETVTTKVLFECVLPLINAYRAATPSATWDLPYGRLGAVVGVNVHPLFRLALSTRAPAACPLRLATLCETVLVPAPNIAELTHSLLTQAGIISLAPLSVEELELAEFYEQLHERLPRVFTIKQLQVIIRDVMASGGAAIRSGGAFVHEPSPLLLIQRVLESVLRTSCGVFQTDDGAALHQSVSEQIKAKLLLPSCKGVVPREWSSAGFLDKSQTTYDELVQRFATLVELHRRVLILGPHFSGKTRMWKKWFGESLPLILSPQLMTAADFYGNESQKGFLSQVASLVTLTEHPKRTPAVVLEGVDAPSSFDLFTQTWSKGARTPEGTTSGTCVMASPLLCVIATALEARNITPGVVDGFAMVALAGPSSWKSAIQCGLSYIPEGESARVVFEVLLPLLVERVSKMSPQIVGSVSELTNMCAIAHRAASLCSRWYAHALSIRTHSDVLTPQDDDDEVDLRLFAARCAVMAASWSVGLSLPAKDREAVKLTLLSAEADVMKALAAINLSGEVFPELTYNSISPLEQVVLPQGWMSFDEAARRTDLPLSWADYRQMNPQLQVPLQVLATPSRLTTLRSMECLMNCGQHVLIHAGAVNGKTTLLHTMRTCENWVTQVFQMSAGFNATQMQQTMSGALSRRSSGRYGPLLGRRLVVCIDDLHLSPPSALNENVPMAGAFMSYCERFRAISTPALGTIPTSDVVLCATTVLHALSHGRCSAGASSGCVDVLLPPFDGDEIASGLLQVCDTASSRKRAKGFSQDCAAFLDLVHSAYCQLNKRSLLLAKLPSATPLGLSPYSIDSALPLSEIASSQLLEAKGGVAPAETVLRTGDSFFYTQHFRELLEAAEVIRLHLLSTVSDFQVAARVFIGVATFYDERLSTSTDVLSANTAATGAAGAAKERHRQVASREFRNAVVQAAQNTLRNSVRGNVEFSDLAQELPDAFLRDVVTDADESRIAQLIAVFESAVQTEEETQLIALVERSKSNTAVKKPRFSDSATRAETRHASVLFNYPDSLKAAAVRAEGVNKEVYVRKASIAAPSSARSSRHNSTASMVLSEMSSIGSQRPPSRMETPTYQTTWLTTRFVHLEDALSAPESHLLLLGDNTFGLRRLFRLWCATTRVPFAWFRVNAAHAHRDVCNTFFAELRATITYVCRNSIHAVAYLPPVLLRIPEVLCVMDALVRSGDVSSLFTDEERYALLHGMGAKHSRSLKPFTFVDDTELRERLRGSLNFVFHLYDVSEAQELVKGYPFLSQPNTVALPLYTKELEKSLLEEIALGILNSSDFSTDGIHRMEDEIDGAATASSAGAKGSDGDALIGNSTTLTPRVACTALCGMFDYVCRHHPTPVEQFISLVRLYKELDDTARVQVVASAQTGRIIAERGDAAVQLMSTTKQRNRAIVQELAAMQLKLALLTEKLRGQERQCSLRTAEAERSREALLEMKASIQRRQSATEKTLEDVKGGVVKALKQVRKMKSGAVRALSMSRVPEKGTLLLRALYAVLGEEVPKYNDNASELWTLSMKRMCTKEFAAELATVAPESGGERLSVLLTLRRELDVVRFAPALPYAQVLTDFVVAWVDCARYLAEDYPAALAEVIDAQEGVDRDEAAYREKQDVVALAQKVSRQTSAEVVSLQNALDVLRKEQDSLSGSEGRLLKYTGLVDRFTRFLLGPAGVAERLRCAKCAPGDTLLVAAFYTLLAVYEDSSLLSAGLQEVLSQSVDSMPLHFSPLPKACLQLLYQTHAPKTEALTAFGCDAPWEYTALLLSLYQRRASRWTLVGGAEPVIVCGLLNFLSFSCTSSVTISAVDPLVRERLAAAMRTGGGVLLRDVHSAASFDLVRSLNLVYQKLKEYYTNLRRRQRVSKDGSASQSRQSALKRAAARPLREEAARPVVSVWFDGQEVRVHPKFFLVCICFPVVASSLKEACESLDVFNLHSPLRSTARIGWLLSSAVSKPSVSTKIASMHEEVQTRQQACFWVLRDFMEAHDSAAALLATDLRDISGSSRGDALLAEMEQSLAQVDVFEGQMAQTASYVQSLQRTVQEGWDTILPAIKAVVGGAEQIEAKRLGRPWNLTGLDSCIAGISDPSSALIRRIAPLSFSDLPIGQKCFYALTHFIQRVVELLAPGWPAALKGLFSLSLLCSAMSAAPATFAAESKLPMLTDEQRRVLAALVYDAPTHEAAGKTSGTEAKLEEGSSLPGEVGTDIQAQRKHTIQQLFASSDDAVLRRVAHTADDGTSDDPGVVFGEGGETAFFVAQLFAALQALNVERASSYANSLFSAFMSSVTGFYKGTNCPAAQVSSHRNPAEKSRAKSVALPGSSAFESGVAGEARQHCMTSDASDRIEANAELLTVDAQIQRAVRARLPLCLIAEGKVEDALMWLESDAKETKWVFKWKELAPPFLLPATRDMPQRGDAADPPQREAALLQAFEEATQQVISLARAPCAPETCGVVLTLVVDIAADASSSAAPAADLLQFREEWHRLLSLYSSLPTRGGDGTLTLCLAVVCSAAAHQLCWGRLPSSTSTMPRDGDGLSCVATVPCCYLSLSSYTPQLALFELLRPTRRLFTKNGVLQMCDAILQQVQGEPVARQGDEVSHEKRPTRVRGPALAKQNSSRSGAALAFPLPELPQGLSAAALGSLQRSVSELRSCACLLLHEMLVSYVASTTRLHLLYALDELSGDPAASAAVSRAAEERLWRRHVYDPAPLFRLHDLLAAWMRQRYTDLVVQLEDSSTTTVLASESPLLVVPASAATTKTLPTQIRTVSTLPAPLRAVTHRDSADGHMSSFGMQAYYYLRRSQPAWELLLRKARHNLVAGVGSTRCPGNVEATAEMFNPAICSVMCASNAPLPDGESANALSRSVRVGVVRAAGLAQQGLQCQQVRQIEEAGRQWAAGLFVLARKYAFHFLCSRLERRSDGTTNCALPLLEQRAQWDMLCAFIGSSGEADEISFLWGSHLDDGRADTRKWYDLRIRVSQLESFRSEVAEAPTDLMELSGEVNMVRRFRALRQEGLLRSCFSPRIHAGAAIGESVDASATTATARAKRDGRCGMHPEAAFALSALRDACESTNGGPSSSLTLVETMLEWESGALNTCATKQSAAPGDNFMRMVQSLASAIEFRKAGARTPSSFSHQRLPHMWLPALHHPLFDLHYLTSASLRGPPNVLAQSGASQSPRMQSLSRSRENPFADMPFAAGEDDLFIGARRCGELATVLVIVVTQQRFLSTSDIVLCGAKLSPVLRQKVLRATSWKEDSCHRGNGAGVVPPMSLSTENEMVVVMRQVLLRRSRLKEDAISEANDLSGVYAGSDRRRLFPVEVGMYVKQADSSLPELIWRSALFPQASTAGALWDTIFTCRPAYPAPVSQSVSKSHSGSFAPKTRRTSKGFFVTEVGAESGDSSFQSAEKTSCKSVRRMWSFSDAPVPVHWCSVSDDGLPRVVEFPLCVEYDLLDEDNQSLLFSSATEGPLTVEKATDGTEVVVSVLPLRSALNTYLRID